MQPQGAPHSTLCAHLYASGAPCPLLLWNARTYPARVARARVGAGPAGCAFSLRGAPSVKGGSRPPREAYYLTHRRSTIVASAACLNSWPPRVAPPNGRPFPRSHSPGAGTDAGAVSLHDTAPASVPVPGECDLGNGRPLGDFGAGNFQIECNRGAGGQGGPPPTLGLGQRFNHRSFITCTQRIPAPEERTLRRWGSQYTWCEDG